MRFLRRLNPVPGLKDFWSEFRRPNPHRWPVLALSIAIPLVGLYFLAGERYVGLPKKPDVIYISTFDPDRTREEIIASNEANQARKEALAAREQERLEVRRELYRELGQATGIDTDKMEREIAQDEARKKAAEQARRKELLGRAGLDDTTPKSDPTTASSTPEE